MSKSTKKTKPLMPPGPEMGSSRLIEGGPVKPLMPPGPEMGPSTLDENFKPRKPMTAEPEPAETEPAEPPETDPEP